MPHALGAPSRSWTGGQETVVRKLPRQRATSGRSDRSLQRRWHRRWQRAVLVGLRLGPEPLGRHRRRGRSISNRRGSDTDGGRSDPDARPRLRAPGWRADRSSTRTPIGVSAETHDLGRRLTCRRGESPPKGVQPRHLVNAWKCSSPSATSPYPRHHRDFDRGLPILDERRTIHSPAQDNGLCLAGASDGMGSLRIGMECGSSIVLWDSTRPQADQKSSQMAVSMRCVKSRGKDRSPFPL